MRIDHYAFGTIRIDGRTYHRDVKIVNNRVISDWHRKAGHRAAAGDLADAIDAGVETIVLGTGSPGRMEPEPDLVSKLAEKGIRLIAKPTAEAVAIFNRLHQKNQSVAAGFHLTC